jgi:hypothetical protein
MASAARKISGTASRGPSSVEARLADLEEEAARLREEVASLQDEIRWLTGEDDDDRGLLSHRWLDRGWVRASMLMAVVGFVAFVSVPYLFYGFEASPSQAATTPAAVSSAPSSAGPVVRPAVIAPGTAAPEYILTPARGRSPEVPPPAQMRTRPAAARGEAR